MAPFLPPHRLVSLCVALFLVILLLCSALRNGEPIQALKHTAHSAADRICSGNEPIIVQHDPSTLFQTLYAPIRHPVSKNTYVDPAGREWSLSSAPSWTEPLKEKILIVDMDTRIPDGDNELWNPTTMNYETLDASKGSQMVSAALMNHFIYSQIHGYDYKFVAADHIKGHHDTWIKPHVLEKLLPDYQFVVFIDADATIQHLDVPLEWLFNKWEITPRTSIAMPLDTEQVLNDDRSASLDSKGKIVLNTGVIVAQSLPLTFEMLKEWKECTKGKRYSECGHWAQDWSHEQRAFSEYIRYDFNPDGDNVVELPCDDAMGFPNIVEENPHILSNCTGQFIRHQTISKERTKDNASNALLQAMAQLMQKTLQKDRDKYWMSEITESWMEKFLDYVG